MRSIRAISPRELFDALDSARAEQESAGSEDQVQAQAADRVRNMLGQQNLSPSQRDLIPQMRRVIRREHLSSKTGVGSFSIPYEHRVPDKDPG